MSSLNTMAADDGLAPEMMERRRGRYVAVTMEA